MSSPERISTDAALPSCEWQSLVDRSSNAWEELGRGEAAPSTQRYAREMLQSYSSLQDFLCKAGDQMMAWFFQRRDAFLSQERMTKWNCDNLDDYVLLPALPGYVSRSDCFFVSHFWHSSEHPDPDGKYLRLLQAELQQQQWSYIWVDWTCVPQHPRSDVQEAYFLRSLETMSGIIRNAGFVYCFPPFEARLWILYEVAEFLLTSCGGFPLTPDITEFYEHVQEMLRTSVRLVLEKYGYKCSYERDKAFLTSWLEVLVLLKRLQIDLYSVRRIMDSLTWYRTAGRIEHRRMDGNLRLEKFEGALSLNGHCYTFTPFPRWDGGKYSTSLQETI